MHAFENAHNRGLVAFSVAALFFLAMLAAGSRLVLDRLQVDGQVTLPPVIYQITVGRVAALFILGMVLSGSLLYFEWGKRHAGIALILNVLVLAALFFFAATGSLTLLRVIIPHTLSGGGS